MILHGPIHTLLPKFLMAADDAGSGTALQDAPSADDLPEILPSTTTEQERVEGEIKPDFGNLGKKIEKPTEKEPEHGKAKEKEEKPATSQPDAKAKPVKEEPKAREQPKTDQRAVEKPKAEPETKPKVEPEKQTEAAKKKEERDAEDDKIDAIKVHPNAPDNVKKSFHQLNALTKGFKNEAKIAKTQLAELNTKIQELEAKAGTLPPELQEKVQKAEKYLMTLEMENNEVFQKHYVEPVKTAEEGVFKWLTDHQASEELVKAIKETGIEQYNWLPIFEHLKNPMIQRELQDLIIARQNAIKTKEGKLLELKGDQGKIIEEFNQAEQDGRLAWAQEVEHESIKLAAKHEWLRKVTLDADATTEEKAANDVRNAEIDKHAASFIANVRAGYERDPHKTSDMALKAVWADYLSQQVQDKSKSLETALARIEEMEAQLSRFKGAGRVTHQDANVITDMDKKVEAPPQIGGDGREAVKKYFQK